MSSVLDDTTTPRTLLQAVIDNKAVNASAYPSRKRKSISKTPVIRSTRKRTAESETADRIVSDRPVTRYETKKQSERIVPTPGSAHQSKRRRRSSIGAQLNESSWNTITPRSNIMGFLSQADVETPLAASQDSAAADDELPDIPSIKKMGPAVDMSMYEDTSDIEKSQNRQYVSRRGKHRDLRQLKTLNEFSKALKSLPDEYTSTQKETRLKTPRQRKAANELHDFTLSSLDENEETLYLSQMEDETLPSEIVARTISSSVLQAQYEASAVQGRSGRLRSPTRRSATLTESSDTDGAMLKDQVDRRGTLHLAEGDQNQNATVPSSYDELPSNENERVEDSNSDSDSNQQSDVIRSLRLLETTESTNDKSLRNNELLMVSRRQSNREVISEEEHGVSRRKSRRQSSFGQNVVERNNSEEMADISRTRRLSLKSGRDEHEVSVNQDDGQRTASANQNSLRTSSANQDSRRTSSANHSVASVRIEQQEESESAMSPTRHLSRRKSSVRHVDGVYVGDDDESEAATSPTRRQSRRRSSLRRIDGVVVDGQPVSSPIRRQSIRKSSVLLTDEVGGNEIESATSPTSLRKSSVRLGDEVGGDETEMSPNRHQSRQKSSSRRSDEEGYNDYSQVESTSESVVAQSHGERGSVMKHSNVGGANYSQKAVDANSAITHRMQKSFSNNEVEVDVTVHSHPMGRRSSPRKSAVILSSVSNMERASSSCGVRGRNLSVLGHISSGNNADLDSDISVHQRQNTSQSVDQSGKRQNTPQSVDQSRKRQNTPQSVDQSRKRQNTPQSVDQSRKRQNTPQSVDQSRKRQNTPQSVDQSRKRQNTPQSLDQSRKSLPSTGNLTPVVPPNEDISEEEDDSGVNYSELNTPHFSPSRRILPSAQKTAERISKTDSTAKIQKSSGQSQSKPKTSRPQKKTSSTLKIPTSQTRRLFSHFAKMRVSKQAIAAVENVCERYWRHLAIDLEAYSAHANRKTINEADLELLMKRQGFISKDQSLHRLVEKFLPLEHRQEIIPVARSGNIVVPKN